jgi:hypothetical protein
MSDRISGRGRPHRRHGAAVGFDAAADPTRRAWAPCPRCADHTGCEPCTGARTCEAHWRYLLAAARRQLFLQCPGCRHRWWHDTGFGVDDRPAHVDELPLMPPSPAA